MDQNLEPKCDMEEQRKDKLTAKRVSLKKSGVYFLGDSCSTSFVGYISGAMTEEEIKEYIEVQERLKPRCSQERDRPSRQSGPASAQDMVDDDDDDDTAAAAAAAVTTATTNQKIKLSLSLETPDEPPDDDDDDDGQGRA